MKLNIKIIKTKTAVLICLSVVLLFSSAGVLSFYYSSKTLNESINQSFISRAVDNSNLLSQIFQSRLATLSLIAEDDKIKTMDWEVQNKELQKYVKAMSVKRFRIIDKSGLANATDGYVRDLSDRDYFIKALNGIPNISDLLKSKVDNSLVICYAVPIKDENNRVISVLSYTEDYRDLDAMISNIKIGEKGYAFLINREGVFLAYPDKRMIMSGETVFELAKKDSSINDVLPVAGKIIIGNTGSAFYTFRGEDKYIAYTPVAGTNWILGITVPKAELFSVVDSMKNNYIGSTIVFVCIALLLYCLIFLYFLQNKKVKNLEKDIGQNNEQLKKIEELDRLKTEFMANVSHELRTPLTIILSTLQLFDIYEKGDKNSYFEKIKKHTASMQKNGLRLLRLINNLIDITKLDAGFYELNPKYVNVVNLINEITLSVSEYANNKGLTIQFQSEIKEKYLLCDPDKIERIMLNLISNAIKFTKPGGYILIKMIDNRDSVTISVKDSGVGIPKEKQGIIFERFRQVEQSLTRSYEGSGIGLSLVKALIEMHKGKISLVSEAGKGSEFIIELPAVFSYETDKNEQLVNTPAISGINQEAVRIELSDISYSNV